MTSEPRTTGIDRPGAARGGLRSPRLAEKGRVALNLELGRFSLRFRILNAALFFCPHFCFNLLRTALYRLAGVRIGADTVIYGGMELSGDGRYWKRLAIGSECQITAPLYLDLNAPITIGDRVALGHHVKLVTSGHKYGSARRRCGEGWSEPIVIGDGAWIGAGAIILPGVTIGSASVVGAGAVVTRDVPPNTLVAGAPARIIRELPR
jgi:NDP-sugar pyrophosphorylase family protein